MAEKGVILNIESRVCRLVEAHSALSVACSSLTSERDRLLEENRALQMRIKELESQLSVSELCDGFGGASANRERAKARVNRLLREVDRCIALLNKQE